MILLAGKTFAQPLTLLGTTSNTCTNQFNGLATFSLNINTYPYSAVVAGVCNTVNLNGINSSTFSINNLGTCINNSQQIAPYNQYTLTLKDGTNALVGNLTFTIGSTYPFFLLQPNSYNNITCNNANDGMASFITVYGNGPFTYIWASSTNSTYATTNFINNAAAGFYTVVATDGNGCKMNQLTSFYNPTVVQLTHTLNPAGQPGCCNGILSFSATGGTPGGSTTYTFSTVPSISSYTSVCSGIYTLTATDNKNCKDSYSITVNCVTGMNEKEYFFEQINLFPNPNNGQFNIHLRVDEELPTFISIQNSLGQIILNMIPTSHRTNVDFKDVPQGIYIVYINYKEYTIIKKIIKE